MSQQAKKRNYTHAHNPHPHSTPTSYNCRARLTPSVTVMQRRGQKRATRRHERAGVRSTHMLYVVGAQKIRGY